MSLKLGNFKIRSSTFTEMGKIPKRNSGYGENVSPELEWSGAPSGTREYALICFDPDAPMVRGFTHWVLYGIPATVTKLSEGQKSDAFTAGVNGMSRSGYFGPMPPKGHGTHHYYFWVYALDSQLSLKSGLNLQQFWEAINGHVLEQARIVGTYEN